MEQPRGDDERERIEAERLRRERVLEALEHATLDDLSDALSGRFDGWVLVHQSPHRTERDRHEHAYHYGGGLAAARGLAEWAADEMGWAMMNPPADDEDEPE